MATRTRERAPASLHADQGSFRDPSGGVLHSGDRILRYFRPEAAAAFQGVIDSGLLQALELKGSLIPTRSISSTSDADLYTSASSLTEGEVGLLLEHERIPFLSYAYGWPFEMLRDAALCTLETIEEALNSGFMVKDATPFNIQFVGPRPVFIDVASIEKYEDGQIWTGYSQFCRTFLNPLMLQALRDVPYHPWLRHSLDGIDPSDLSRVLGLANKLRPSVFIHVVLQAMLNRRTSAFAPSGEKHRPVSREATLQLVRGLQGVVSKLHRKRRKSTWIDYEDELPYADEAVAAKERFVEESVRAANPGVLWDLGCNRGLFSTLAAAHAGYVVAMDFDEATVGALYERVKGKFPNLLPLVVDLMNPEPDQGWAQSERQGLAARGPADFALALALVHHLRISGNVPLSRIFGWLSDVTSAGVVEFVPRADPMVQRLLSTRKDVYGDYDEAQFEAALSREFAIEERHQLPGSERILYRFGPRR
jgi:ribosomal protein L11 methylase PrmA